MYGYGLHHRLLVAVGCMGLAGLMPYGALPTWVAVVLAVLPIAVLELGAGLEEDGAESGRDGLCLAGWHLQAYGALLYLVPFVVLGSHALRTRPPSWPFLVTVACLGVPSAVSTLLAWRHVLAGRGAARPDPDRAAEQLWAGTGRSRIADGIRVIGAEPFTFGAIGLVLAAAAGFVLFRDTDAAGLEMLIALAFFGGVVLMAVAQGLERWEARVPGTSATPLQDALQTFALLGFTGALLAFGLWWPELSPAWRTPPIVVGGLGVAAAAWLGLKRLGALPSPYCLVATDEGLVERTRMGTLLYPWRTILDCRLGELAGNACIRLDLDLDDPAAWQVVRVRAGLDPARLVERRRKAMASNRRWVGADLFALGMQIEGGPGAFHRRVSAFLDRSPDAAADLEAPEEVAP